jgi:hypothetical protein
MEDNEIRRGEGTREINYDDRRIYLQAFFIFIFVNKIPGRANAS